MDNLIFAVETPPAEIIAWLVVGLIAGWVASMMLKGRGYGTLGDIVIGVIGSYFGGLGVISFYEGPGGFWGSIFVAIVGACGLIVLMLTIRGRQKTLRL